MALGFGLYPCFEDPGKGALENYVESSTLRV